MKIIKKIFSKKSAICIIILFVLINGFIIIHTYKFTHYNPNVDVSEKKESISLQDILFGIDLPRPTNDKKPLHRFENIKLIGITHDLEGWLIKTDSINNRKGIVFLAHGYNSSKSSMLEKADLFLSEGYDTFLLDFMGVGDSEGNQTTIGYKEADNIKHGYDFLIAKYNNDVDIILFGTSMGAVAIMKSIHDYPSEIKPKAVILECPYGTMLETVKARFKIMNMPQWIAYPFTFWGGTINGFNAFSLKPVNYAPSIAPPTLLIYGKNDDRVSMKETQAIFDSLNQPKYLKIYENSGHDNYLKNDKNGWTTDIKTFIDSI